MTNRKKIALVVIILVVVFILFLGIRARQNKEKESPNAQYEIPPYAERGPYVVGIQSIEINGDNPLTLTIWYPASGETPNQKFTYAYKMKLGKPLGSISIASFDGLAVQDASFDLADAPYPLVVLSPGFSIGSSAYAWLAEHLASYGFVVVSPEHQEHLDPESQLWRAAITRPSDVQSIFAYLDNEVKPDGIFEGVVDPDTVAVIGHSYGGYTTLAAAGAKISTKEFQSHCQQVIQEDHEAAWLCEMLIPHLGDMAELAGLDEVPSELWPSMGSSRVDAIVPMAGDAFFFGETGLAEIHVPIMAIGGTADNDSPFAWGTHPSYEFSSSSRKVEIALEGAEHMIFTASCEQVRWYMKPFSKEFCADSTWGREYAHALTKHFTTAFLLTELKQDHTAETFLNPENVDFIDVTYSESGYQ